MDDRWFFPFQFGGEWCCPVCRKTLEREGQPSCRICGAQMAWVVPSKAYAACDISKVMWHSSGMGEYECPHCTNPLPYGLEECLYCGTKVEWVCSKE